MTVHNPASRHMNLHKGATPGNPNRLRNPAGNPGISQLQWAFRGKKYKFSDWKEIAFQKVALGSRNLALKPKSPDVVPDKLGNYILQ